MLHVCNGCLLHVRCMYSAAQMLYVCCVRLHKRLKVLLFSTWREVNEHIHSCLCVRVCVPACVRACVRACASMPAHVCVWVCVCVYAGCMLQPHGLQSTGRSLPSTITTLKQAILCRANANRQQYQSFTHKDQKSSLHTENITHGIPPRMTPAHGDPNQRSSITIKTPWCCPRNKTTRISRTHVRSLFKRLPN